MSCDFKVISQRHKVTLTLAFKVESQYVHFPQPLLVTYECIDLTKSLPNHYQHLVIYQEFTKCLPRVYQQMLPRLGKLPRPYQENMDKADTYQTVTNKSLLKSRVSKLTKKLPRPYQENIDKADMLANCYQETWLLVSYQGVTKKRSVPNQLSDPPLRQNEVTGVPNQLSDPPLRQNENHMAAVCRLQTHWNMDFDYQLRSYNKLIVMVNRGISMDKLI